MIRVAIVDDEENERRILSKNFSGLAETTGVRMQCDLYESGVAFLAAYQAQYDIICLDIDMPYRDGIDTAAEIRKKDENVYILFVTNMAQMAIRGYEVNAFDFIVKPVNSYAFSLKLRNVLGAIEQLKRRLIVVQCSNGFHRIASDDLIYVESEAHYIIYHTKFGNFRQKGSMKETELRMRGLSFALCNQSYLVNLSYVSAIQHDEVNVGGEWLKISRPKRKQFLEAVSKFIGGFYQCEK